MKTVLQRIYSDYLMPSRLHRYEALLDQAQTDGYAQLSLRAFLQAPTGPVLVHRHDIDSDLRTARKMFAIETRYGVRASYYFRLSTLDPGFMRDIEAYGSEASYHFEEVADYAKQNRIRNAAELRLRFPEIRLRFFDNFQRIEAMVASKLTTVASHGDFANRRLKVINHEILREPAFRARCGIRCEAYDPEVLAQFDLYISDKPFPRYFHPVSPFDALGRYQRICLLTHPVQWETNWAESTRCNVRRLYEEMAWQA
ncbi:MAG: hypothetical protein V4508_13220 [Pseudomonadota bacterium]